MTTTVEVDAQQKKTFTLEDLNYGGSNYRNMVPENRYCTWWGDRLVRLDHEYCYLVDIKTGKETQLLNTGDINRWMGKTKDIKISSFLRADVSFPYADRHHVVINADNRIYVVDFKEGKLVSRADFDGCEILDRNHKSGAVAYLKDNDLYVRRGEETMRLSKDGSREIVYGQAVHRNEFGIMSGVFFSPDGGRMAFYRMDQSMVSDYPQVDIPATSADTPGPGDCIAKAAPDKYPMAGDKSHKVTVGVADLSSGNIVYLDAGDPTDRYFTNVAWSSDGRHIYMFELNRDQNDCRLTCYDAATGKKQGELYQETDAKYVEPQHPVTFLPWDANSFVMQSRKDGYNHLYLCTLESPTKIKSIRQLTSGSWEVMDLLGFNASARSIVIASNELSPIQCNVFSVDTRNGKRTLLDDKAPGWHSGMLSGSARYLLDNYSTPDTPRNISIVDTRSLKRTAYFSAADPWEGYSVPTFECGTIKADDGVTDLYWRMVKPADFDPTRRYPTVVYVYGGPHAHNVDARWHYCSRGWETYMAQKGYIVFILDNRGSEHRGKDFEQVTFRQLGQEEMKDQMRGVAYLKSLPYVDADRLGVHGWSFGGFMTISLMTNYPDVFKVGVAGGPVIDWRFYEVMYGERYMDTPAQNPEGYSKTSLLRTAKNLKGKLQVIHGYNDPTCVMQHSLSFLKECVKAGTQPDFFVYPGEPHNMRGHASVHLHERITQYFEDYLK